jgi:hypothetical protein
VWMLTYTVVRLFGRVQIILVTMAALCYQPICRVRSRASALDWFIRAGRRFGFGVRPILPQDFLMVNGYQCNAPQK